MTCNSITITFSHTKESLPNFCWSFFYVSSTPVAFSFTTFKATVDCSSFSTAKMCDVSCWFSFNYVICEFQRVKLPNWCANWFEHSGLGSMQFKSDCCFMCRYIYSLSKHLQFIFGYYSFLYIVKYRSIFLHPFLLTLAQPYYQRDYFESFERN